VEGKVKEKWLLKFKEKYERVSKELKKDIIRAADFRDAPGGPGLKHLKKRTGYTFMEAERAIGIVRENADKIIEAARNEGAKIFCIGRNMGKGSKIYLRDCTPGCNAACSKCEYFTEDMTVNSLTVEEAGATRYDQPSHMSVSYDYPDMDVV
jgi:hypothetical protein